MTLPDFQKIKRIFDKENIKSNKKLMIYMFFVVLATIFWFLNALSKEYTTTVNYPVTYSDFPAKKILNNQLPSKLRLTVRAYGFDLLRYKFSFIQSIDFPVNELTNNRMEKAGVDSYYFPTSRMTSEVASQLSSAISITHIFPDTISFEFSPLIEKMMPIHLNSRFKYEAQFRLGGYVILNPDSVLVIGPQALIDSIKQVETELLELDKLSETTTKNISLEKIKGLKIGQKKVEVVLPVEQFTEAQKQIEIKVVNLPDSLLLRLFPHEVKLSYLVGLKDYETITSDQFHVEVDYEKIDLSFNKLKVGLKRFPGNVSNVSFYPHKVVYLIEKKNKGK